jgi:hypothetical protein
MDHATNDLSDFSSAVTNNSGSHKVALYTVSSTGALTRGTLVYYNPGTLTVNTIKNENWVSTNSCFGTTEEYKDVNGNVVLKRTYNLKTVSA